MLNICVGFLGGIIMVLMFRLVFLVSCLKNLVCFKVEKMIWFLFLRFLSNDVVCLVCFVDWK